MPHYDAVIFDLDGTLLDSERLVVEAGLEVLAALGREVHRSFLDSLIGISGPESRIRLEAVLGPDTERFDLAWSEAVRRRYEAGIPLMPGAVELISLLEMPRAVATNSATANATRKLRGAGLVDHFDAIVGYDLVARPKPAPDVFLEAARRLSAVPARCLVFEDSDPGVAAALAAGMTVVQVPDQHHSGSAGAHHLATSLLEGARAAGLLS